MDVRANEMDTPIQETEYVRIDVKTIIELCEKGEVLLSLQFTNLYCMG